MSRKEKISKDTNSNWVDDVSSTVPAKVKKPLYKRWWFILIVAIVVICIIAVATSGGSNDSNTSSKSSSSSSSSSSSQSTTDSTSDMTTAESNAYSSAKDYLSSQAFSKKGLIDQLSSKDGEGYAKKDAEYAIKLLEKNKEVSWNTEAYKAAKEYLSSQSFSKDGLIEQLESSSGDQYTHKQAVYGANKAYK